MFHPYRKDSSYLRDYIHKSYKRKSVHIVGEKFNNVICT